MLNSICLSLWTHFTSIFVNIRLAYNNSVLWLFSMTHVIPCIMTVLADWWRNRVYHYSHELSCFISDISLLLCLMTFPLLYFHYMCFVILCFMTDTFHSMFCDCSNKLMSFPDLRLSNGLSDLFVLWLFLLTDNLVLYTLISYHLFWTLKYFSICEYFQISTCCLF